MKTDRLFLPACKGFVSTIPGFFFEKCHRNDQRYFCDWEKFSDAKELNEKLRIHLAWSNRKPMRTLGGKRPLELLKEKMAAA